MHTLAQRCNLNGCASHSLKEKMKSSSNTVGQISVAPMMAYTDRHCRYLHRLASPSALLFTEMITTGALLHGPRQRLLAYDPSEHPVAVQLGGSDPGDLAAATAMASAAGFDEINLNVGCPSARVQEGRIGACLMAEPELVARCFTAMQDATDRPVTIKCRLGIDEQTSDEFLHRFIDTTAEAGCRTFYVHARVALLNGLSPAQNRSVPPLQYERVFALKRRNPELRIVLNGGLTDTASVKAALEHCDGAMIGRAAYSDPMLLSALHAEEADSAAPTLTEVFKGYRAYVERQFHQGTPLSNMTRHLLGVCAGLPGARKFRRTLSDASRLKASGPEILDEAWTIVEDSVARHAA